MVVSLSWFSVGGAVNASSLVRVLDKVMPPASVIEGRVMSVISSADFPQVFSSVISPTIPTISTPAEAVAALEVGNSTASVVKVIARNACGVDSEGTGFVVAPNEVLTNFHVVAGAGEVSVDGSTATSMGFDSLNDLALLHVGTHGLKALSFSSAAQGATAAIVGYPLDGPRRLTPAAVADVLSVSSRDVYNKVSFTRSLLGLSATVEPGNSGSPVFVHGRVAGVVVSKSLSQKNTAYAIPATVATAFIAHPTGTGFGACRK